MKLRRLLITYLRPYRGKLTVTVLLQAAQAITTLILPGLSGDIVDNGILTGDTGYIWRVGGLMLGYGMLQVVLAVAAMWYGAQVAMGVCRDIRRDLFHTVTGFSAHEVTTLGAPSLVTRITNDVQQIQMLVVMLATMLLSSALTVVFGIFMALREDVGLSVVMFVSIPFVVVVIGFLIARMIPSFQRMQVRVDNINAVLREQITGIRVVRAFAREPQETERFTTSNRSVTEVALTTGRIQAFFFPAVQFVIGSANIAVLWLGAPRIETGDLAIGSLIAYLTYLLQVLWSVVMFSFIGAMIPRAAVAAERIGDVLDTEPSVRPPATPTTVIPRPGSVTLTEVGFQYPGADEPVLADINFDTPPGTTTAIIGSTGAGKTTLVNLILRMFDATEGTVAVNGVDVRDLAPETLWSAVGYVPQKAFLFSGTVASNLRYGQPDATDEQLWQALEVAQATDFVQAMPDGIDSEITQGGTNVSGGQRQRLSIARALVVNPDVYIFDDSFSALDLATEARLQAALRPTVSAAAVIVVAQRISSIRDADQIIVLERGRIVGKGRHDELVETCRTYREIVESQHAQGAPV